MKIKILLVANNEFYKKSFKTFLDSCYENIELTSDKDVIRSNIDLVLIYAQDIKKSLLLKDLLKYRSKPVFLLSDKLQQEDFLDCSNLVSVLPLEISSKFLVDLILLYLGSVNVSDRIKNLNLQPKEQLFLKCLIEGYSDKDIMRMYDLSISTVKYHLRSLYRALGVTSRDEAVLEAREIGF